MTDRNGIEICVGDRLLVTDFIMASAFGKHGRVTKVYDGMVDSLTGMGIEMLLYSSEVELPVAVAVARSRAK